MRCSAAHACSGTAASPAYHPLACATAHHRQAYQGSATSSPPHRNSPHSNDATFADRADLAEITSIRSGRKECSIGLRWLLGYRGSLPPGDHTLSFDRSLPSWQIRDDNYISFDRLTAWTEIGRVAPLRSKEDAGSCGPSSAASGDRDGNLITGSVIDIRPPGLATALGEGRTRRSMRAVAGIAIYDPTDPVGRLHVRVHGRQVRG